MSNALQSAVTRVLSPLVRFLLRHGVSHAEFASWAKKAYVDEAKDHFGIEGKSPTVSRIAVVTGINRKEVKRLQELPELIEPGVSKHNRAVRVVTGWLQDQEYNDANGKPQVLNYGDAEDSFNQLVKRYGGDVPAKAVLDELERVGTVKVSDTTVRLAMQGYIPHKSQDAMLDVFATSAKDLLETLEHNLNENSHKRLQMSVAYDDVTQAGVTAFKKISSEKAMTLLRELDKELSVYDRGANTKLKDDGGHRIGLGVYLIEESAETNDETD
ncbi:MAG: hypothetical protein KTR35_11690 [Gammaproteobacteria bacterium]|nr:hypothetical protein [Gammaproteobacteria bacterium]